MRNAASAVPVGFEIADLGEIAKQLSERLAKLRGRFILSIDDGPEIRRPFRWAAIEPVPVTYKVNGTKKVAELIVSGKRR